MSSPLVENGAAGPSSFCGGGYRVAFVVSRIDHALIEGRIAELVGANLHERKLSFEFPKKEMCAPFSIPPEGVRTSRGKGPCAPRVDAGEFQETYNAVQPTYRSLFIRTRFSSCRRVQRRR